MPVLDADEHLLGAVIPLVEIVHVVGGDEGQPHLLGKCDNPRDDLLVLLHAVVLELEVVAIREKLLVEPRRLARRLFASVQEVVVHLPAQAGGRAYEALGVLREEFAVDPREIVHALGEAPRDEFAQVVVARLVLGEQQHVVGASPAVRGPLLEPAAGSDVDLAADDGLDARPFRRLVELHRAEHVPVVGERHCGLSELSGALHQIVDARGAVQKAVLGVQMQVDEWRRHIDSPGADFNRGVLFQIAAFV